MKTSLVIFFKRVLPFPLRIQLRKLNWRRRYLTEAMLHPAKAPVYCPIAEKEYKCFIPERHDIWPSQISPENGARSRHRLIWLYLKRETGIFKDKCSLLHIAPEHCYFQKLKDLKNLDYMPGDKMVDGYGKQSGVAYMDLLDLKIKDGTIDYLLCNQVLEHIPDDRKAISEIYRVLKPGATAIITVPIDENIKETYEDFSITAPAEREKHFGQWDHVRWYSTDVKDRFEEAGFSVDLVRYGKQFSAEDYVRFGLCDDLLIIAKKNK
ncbi:methyltransferase family protein [Taibaiella chishuiensis]|uniref:Methyltransferase family protein n=1 Tax=Taibaiella chishuiensis TaxID=1434707 RepID=A0A2P8D0B2_9BACT|nr:methyltransferase family protein [Taibaiella chishuiensis]